jgi:hypothetical protein
MYTEINAGPYTQPVGCFYFRKKEKLPVDKPNSIKMMIIFFLIEFRQNQYFQPWGRCCCVCCIEFDHVPFVLALCLERLGLQSSHVLLIPTTGPTKEEIRRGEKMYIHLYTSKHARLNGL